MEECTGFEPVNRITTVNVLAGHRNRPTLPTFHMEEVIRIELIQYGFADHSLTMSFASNYFISHFAQN